MTSKSTWKRAERETAKLLGTTRNPLSGGAGKHSGSDTLHSTLYVEIKLRAKSAIFSLFKKTNEGAKKEGKVPIVCMREKGVKPGEPSLVLWIVRTEDISALYEALLRGNKNGKTKSN